MVQRTAEFPASVGFPSRDEATSDPPTKTTIPELSVVQNDSVLRRIKNKN